MSKDEELSSFKIGDLKRPTVRTTQARSDSEGGGEEYVESVGFGTIEARLEGSSVDAVADELSESYGKLEEMAGSGPLKIKGGAKKAMAAYERTADLFEYLFATKDAISKPEQ